MVTKPKIALIVAVATLSFASPALAQSYDNDWATGNELPTYSTGGLHAGSVHMQSHIGFRRSGLNAFARVGRPGFTSDEPSSTGGGSVGYNEMLQNDQW